MLKRGAGRRPTPHGLQDAERERRRPKEAAEKQIR
jgi:hypothetical protein